jgi:hypothetical protein
MCVCMYVNDRKYAVTLTRARSLLFIANLTNANNLLVHGLMFRKCKALTRVL